MKGYKKFDIKHQLFLLRVIHSQMHHQKCLHHHHYPHCLQYDLLQYDVELTLDQ